MGDHERPLAPRGLEAAPRMGKDMAKRGLAPDLVLCSTATRARETLALVLEAMRIHPKVVFDRRVYDAGADELVGLIAEFGVDTGQLLVVGHNSAMHIAASRLSVSGDEGALNRLQYKFPSAGLAIIEFGSQDWGRANLTGGRLVAFVTPKTIATG